MKLRMIALLSMLCAVLALSFGAAGRPQEVLRLHVVANSDSDADQAVKLLVRDEILELTAAAFAAAGSAGEAEKTAEAELEEIETAAVAVLRQNGFEYGAAASVTVERFPDREYGGVLYPENDYTALRVVLGDGAGKNWWCLLFPPLCIQEEPGGDSYDTEFRSLISEWLNGGLTWESVFGNSPSC